MRLRDRGKQIEAPISMYDMELLLIFFFSLRTKDIFSIEKWL